MGALPGLEITSTALCLHLICVERAPAFPKLRSQC